MNDADFCPVIWGLYNKKNMQIYVIYYDKCLNRNIFRFSND